MEQFDRSKTPLGYRSVESSIVSDEIHGSSRRRKKQRTPQRSHRICDWITEGLIYWMVIFTPWAFGTTQSWSIWTMNISAYALGVLLITKWVIRWRTGYKPNRLGEDEEGNELISIKSSSKMRFALTITLAVLTGLVLLYILISALNPRAVYHPNIRRLEYQDYIAWLPHSYDPKKTWQMLWMYLGFGFVFWSLHDWLTTELPVKGAIIEEKSFEPSKGKRKKSITLPSRLRRLLWIVSINGAVLALEAILQRLDGTNKLLWIVQPQINKGNREQFGPFAYRSNAATYLNLIWPVCLGFWITLKRHQQTRTGGESHTLLLPCAALIATAPIVSTARGGSLITLGMIMMCVVLSWLIIRHDKTGVRTSILSLFVAVLLMAGFLGWKELARRFETVFSDQMSMRTEIYQNARPIAEDFTAFGVGPGTFSTVYQFYREPQQVWAAYAHDDWLETRITFGWVGFSIILLCLVTSLLGWLYGSGIPGSSVLATFVTVALIGCLVHAKFDFPFQIYSILFLFLVGCCIVFSASRNN